MSVNTISAIEREGYNEEMRLDYERMKSTFMKCTRQDGLLKAGTVVWETVDVTDAAQEKTRDGRIPISNLDHGRVTATPKREYKKYEIDDFDVYRHNSTIRQVQQMKSVGACHRACDQLIVDQLDGTSTEINSGTAISFSTYGNILNWIAQLENNDVSTDNGQIWGAVTPMALRQMMRINEFISHDYVETRKLENGIPGDGYYRWLGVNWFSTTALTGKGTATAKCYLFDTQAVGHQTLGEPDTMVDYNKEDDYWFNWAKISHAAAVVLPRGVVRAVHDDTATFT
ncbi:MAG: phage capsid protein [Pseudomonadota bacterium]